MTGPLPRRMDSIVWLSCGHCPGAQSTSMIAEIVRRFPTATHRMHCHECGALSTINEFITPTTARIDPRHPSQGA